MNIPWHIRCAALRTLYTAGHKVELVVGFSDLSDPLDTVAVCGSAGIAGIVGMLRVWPSGFSPGHKAGTWIPRLSGPTCCKQTPQQVLCRNLGDSKAYHTSVKVDDLEYSFSGVQISVFIVFGRVISSCSRVADACTEVWQGWDCSRKRLGKPHAPS